MPKTTHQTIYLVANGDLRTTANAKCWAKQEEMEKQIVKAVEKEGFSVKRAHGFNKELQHGFIDSQKLGMKVFENIPQDAPLIVAEAVWQYSHHLLPGLSTHTGPILTVANWSGTWPGLVGMLNLNGSMTKAGIKYSSLWSEDFQDEYFLTGLRSWLLKGKVKHETDHVLPLKKVTIPRQMEKLGRELARELQHKKAIMGVFDEGCMGMYNAIIPDELLHRTGVFKERLSQSALYARMLTVSDSEAREVYQWLLDKGMTFHLGSDEETELTENQILQQCKMYVAAVRIADDFGCSAIGIQYQQGLKDLAPASDLVEGLLNCSDRPPVKHEKTGKVLYPNQPLTHFNEVDECAGLDGMVTKIVWDSLGYLPDNTLHDLRWGRQYKDLKLDAYVWVFLISGAAPASHYIGGYRGASGERQPAMYFRLGGSTLKGISKPGWIVWSRVFIEDEKLKFDTGIGEVVELPREETEDRWKETTPQWPIMHVVLQDISRDQMMARHKSNHIQVAYAPTLAEARKALYAKAAMMDELGLKVALCGKV
ncbi:MAG: fucose isomerase [Verrucomicrobiae bacterium]|nr:fucose isomerase [Verrucomicrobiae bacterium]